MFILDHFAIILNLQIFPIPQTSFFVGTFFAVSYSKRALLYKSFKCNLKKTLAPLCVGGTFWNYVYDKDRYNFTQETFVNESERDIRTFVQFVVNATRDYVNLHLKIRSFEIIHCLTKAMFLSVTREMRLIIQSTFFPI